MAEMLKLEWHPFAKKFQLLEGEEFERLKNDIRDNGQENPILYYEDGDRFVGLDGRNREKACRALKIVPKYKKIHLSAHDSPIKLIVSYNLHRRHLNESQRAALAAEIEPELAKEAKKRQGHKPPPSAKPSTPTKGEKGNTARAEAAKAAGASPRATQDAKWLKDKDPVRFEKVKAGDLKLNTAIREVKEEAQHKTLQTRAKAVKPAASEVGLWEMRNVDATAGIANVGNACIDLILTDPPQNVGADYGPQVNDKMPHADYIQFTETWLKHAHRVLKIDGALVVFANDDNAAKLYLLLHALKFNIRRWIKLHRPHPESSKFSTQKNWNRESRHAFYCTKSEQRFTFHPQKDGDQGDVWVVPHCPKPEQVAGFPDQTDEATLLYFINTLTEPHQRVLDPFTGTGSTGRACMEAALGPRHFLGFEKSKKWCEIATARIAEAAEPHESEEPSNGKPAQGTRATKAKAKAKRSIMDYEPPSKFSDI